MYVVLNDHLQAERDVVEKAASSKIINEVEVGVLSQATNAP